MAAGTDSDDGRAGLKVRLRAAERGDTRFLAWVIQEAARSHLERGIWDVALPDDGRRSDFLAALTSTDARSFSHWERFLVAEIDGRLAAAMAGYEPSTSLGKVWERANAEAVNAIRMDKGERLEMAARMRSLGDPYPEVPEDRWVIEWVATAPEFRGRGIVHRLLGAILQRGREAGYTKAQIGYLIGNTPARRAYEGVGFKTVDEKRDPDFELTLGSPGIARMHMDLVQVP